MKNPSQYLIEMLEEKSLNQSAVDVKVMRCPEKCFIAVIMKLRMNECVSARITFLDDHRRYQVGCHFCSYSLFRYSYLDEFPIEAYF